MTMQWVNEYGERQYDWCWPGGTRTRESHPYSFDAHFIWKDWKGPNDKEACDVVYSDRMWQWDREKADKAFALVQRGQRIGDLRKDACSKIIESYYDGKYECAAYALCCNQSTGYEIGIFWLREKRKQ